MKNKSTVEFEIRAYGRTELAMEYLPNLQPGSAYRKFRQWINLSPGLSERLKRSEIGEKTRMWTPAEVKMIVEALGEP